MESDVYVFVSNNPETALNAFDCSAIFARQPRCRNVTTIKNKQILFSKLFRDVRPSFEALIVLTHSIVDSANLTIRSLIVATYNYVSNFTNRIKINFTFFDYTISALPGPHELKSDSVRSGTGEISSF